MISFFGDKFYVFIGRLWRYTTVKKLDFKQIRQDGNIFKNIKKALTGTRKLPTKEIEKESVGGAVKWHCKTKAPNWMVLCCVADEAKDAFETAMKKLYGDECLEKLNVARKGAGRVID